jgi:phosphotransferase system HPr (HPr) family protein
MCTGPELDPATDVIAGSFLAGSVPSADCGGRETMQIRKLKIANPRGLHARACAHIVDIAKRFRCNLSIVVNGRRVQARNIFAVMMLTAAVGAAVRIEVDGPDEISAMKEIATLFRDGLGERR